MTDIDVKRAKIKKALAKELSDLQGTGYNSEDAAEWFMGILDALDVVIKADTAPTEDSGD